jgi:hypothetical protein
VDDAPPIVTGDLSHYGNSVSAYPNPSESFLELVGIKGELFNVKLVDLTGRLNYIEFEKHGDVYQASIQHLSPGVYLLEAQEERVLYRFKVIKK